jgi:hypothetical protein
MEDYLKDKKFEAVKYRHEDQSKLLQYMTTIENQLFRGYLTIQLIFGGFLTQFKIEDFYSKLGLFIIDITLGIVCLKLLHKSLLRRKEVQATLMNCNSALGFDQPNIYLQDRAINVTYITRYWFPWFLTGVIATIFGIFLILFISQHEIASEKSNNTNISLIVNKDTIKIAKDTIIVLKK